MAKFFLRFGDYSVRNAIGCSNTIGCLPNLQYTYILLSMQSYGNNAVSLVFVHRSNQMAYLDPVDPSTVEPNTGLEPPPPAPVEPPKEPPADPNMPENVDPKNPSSPEAPANPPAQKVVVSALDLGGAFSAALNVVAKMATLLVDSDHNLSTVAKNLQDALGQAQAGVSNTGIPVDDNGQTPGGR